MTSTTTRDMTTDPDQSDSVAAAWRENRRAAATAHSQRLDRLHAAEAAQARTLVAEFMIRVADLNIPPQKLVAHTRDSKHVRYRTLLKGWPLRGDGSAAIGTDGEFYYLSVDRSWSARFSGATPSPSAPPLVLGKSGRDGESVDLKDALTRILDQQAT